MSKTGTCQRCKKSVPAYTMNHVQTSKASGNLCMECAMFAFFGQAPPHECRLGAKYVGGYPTCDICCKEMPGEGSP